MRAALHIVASLIALSVACAGEPGMVAIPDSTYRPLFRGEKDAKEIAVAAFQFDARPVTNDEFLAFVRDHPQWRRSQVKRLFADERYLAHWTDDLELGDARTGQPVTNVSWFAAKAFAAAHGKRLPTTAEWEAAAAAGFTARAGAKDAAFQAQLARWYATPSPASLPDAGSGPANFFGVRDLHGLVWEWTSDFNSALVTGDARGDTGIERQLFCGAGSLGAKDTSDYAAFMRFGFRSSLRAGYTVPNLGFRCAKDDQPPCCRAAPDTEQATDKSLYLLDSTWTSDTGRKIKLGVLRGRPQIVALFFTHCEYACPILVSELKTIEARLHPDVLAKVDFLLVSIDPQHDTPDALAAFREKRALPRNRWTLLRGEAEDVRELAALLGVNYAADSRGQFAHSNLITLLNAEGEIAFQHAGLKQDPALLIGAIEQAAQHEPSPANPP